MSDHAGFSVVCLSYVAVASCQKMAKFSAHTHLILAGDSHKVLTSLFITGAAHGGNMVIAPRLYYASTAVNPSNTHSVLNQVHLSRKLVFSCF